MAHESAHHRSSRGYRPGASDGPDEARLVYLPLLEGPARIWVAVILAAVLAGLVGWLLSEWVSSRLLNDGRGLPRPRVLQEMGTTGDLVRTTLGRSQTRAAALTLGVVGGLFGLAFGVAGGWSRSSRDRFVRAGWLGLIYGAIVGILAPFVCFPLLFRSPTGAPSPIIPLVTHTAVYTAVSALAGLVFGYGRSGARGLWKGFLAAVMGGIVGSMFANLAHTLLFPLAWDFSPMPGTADARFLTLLSVAVATGVCLGVIFATDPEARASRTETESTDGPA